MVAKSYVRSRHEHLPTRQRDLDYQHYHSEIFRTYSVDSINTALHADKYWNLVTSAQRKKNKNTILF